MSAEESHEGNGSEEKGNFFMSTKCHRGKWSHGSREGRATACVGGRCFRCYIMWWISKGWWIRLNLLKWERQRGWVLRVNLWLFCADCGSAGDCNFWVWKRFFFIVKNKLLEQYKLKWKLNQHKEFNWVRNSVNISRDNSICELERSEQLWFQILRSFNENSRFVNFRSSWISYWSF